MNHAVEVAYLVNGEVISVRRLSPRAERRSAAAAGALVAALGALASTAVALALIAAHRIVFGPLFLGVWSVVVAGAAVVAWARARGRARHYTVGAGMDDDAFSSPPLALVRRTRAGYQLTVVPGMTGSFDCTPEPADGAERPPRERRPPRSVLRSVLIESLAQERETYLPLERGARAEISLGASTFVVRAVPDDVAPPPLGRGFARSHVRRALIPLEVAALVSVLCAVPVGMRLGEADMKSAIPEGATPWEIEKLLRMEAQSQAHTLHECFDVLPIECQRQGYVGVGLALSRQGEVRSSWIARSTFGQECPVDDCMSNVISTWFFEPMPESMKVILPVQVLRTDMPLPLGAARVTANRQRMAGDQRRFTSPPASVSVSASAK